MSWCVRSFRSLASGVEVHVHLTPCIVATPPRPPAARGEDCCAASHGLVVPANERLAGARFDTSQVHAAGFAEGVIYPEQTVDGRVHELCGASLALLLQGMSCEVGAAVSTDCVGPLRGNYGALVHTVAPHWGRTTAEEWEGALQQCYRRSFEAAESSGCNTLAFPLLGAGARAAPAADATRVAAQSAADWAFGMQRRRDSQGAGLSSFGIPKTAENFPGSVLHTLHWGLQDDDLADLLADSIASHADFETFCVYVQQ